MEYRKNRWQNCSTWSGVSQVLFSVLFSSAKNVAKYNLTPIISYWKKFDTNYYCLLGECFLLPEIEARNHRKTLQCVCLWFYLTVDIIGDVFCSKIWMNHCWQAKEMWISSEKQQPRVYIQMLASLSFSSSCQCSHCTATAYIQLTLRNWSSHSWKSDSDLFFSYSRLLVI